MFGERRKTPTEQWDWNMKRMAAHGEKESEALMLHLHFKATHCGSHGSRA
jgi:hypothetical protein